MSSNNNPSNARVNSISVYRTSGDEFQAGVTVAFGALTTSITLAVTPATTVGELCDAALAAFATSVGN